jgi:hypothetical protein
VNGQSTYWYVDTPPTAQGNLEGRVAPAGYVRDFTGAAIQGAPAQELTRPEGGAGSEVDVFSPLEPTSLSFGRPYPNPVHDGVRVELAVPGDRTGEYLLAVYDVGGRRILESKREIESPGRYDVFWGGRSQFGGRVPSGVYFLKVVGPEGFVETRRVSLMG